MSVDEGRFVANIPELRQCGEEMRDMSREIVSMFADFDAGVQLFSAWPGDGTDKPSQQFQLSWDERNRNVRAVGDPMEQAVVGVVDATLSNMNSIRGTSQYAQDEINDERSRTDSVMDDLDSGYGSDSGSDTRH
ncbi:hypothetical protein ABZ725_08645 [Streptomyces sp. NPDC006872]|uniref:hypothetical protein n=1 Tax=Streptomyces sp. NPDC006872 TaxID=3155720 RepID=UPI0034084010